MKRQLNLQQSRGLLQSRLSVPGKPGRDPNRKSGNSAETPRTDEAMLKFRYVQHYIRSNLRSMG